MKKKKVSDIISIFAIIAFLTASLYILIKNKAIFSDLLKQGNDYFSSDDLKDDYGTIIQKNHNRNLKKDENEAETADWKTYRNEKYGFEMKYPKDWSVFSNNDDESVGIGDKNGQSMNLSIQKKELDENNIQGLYGKIDNPEIVKVGSQKGYSYTDGDAGCYARIIQTQLNKNILEISFGACDGDKNPLPDNPALINKILGTFIFK